MYSASALDAKKKAKERALYDLRRRCEELNSSLQSYGFVYEDPTKNFDRSKVKGRVINLFTVKEAYTDYAQAVEIVAGGKLWHVVVDSDHTGKLLLENGKLKRVVTLIPLNKIVDHSMHPNVAHQAKRIAKEGEVYPAIEFVGYPSDIERAMKFVFGNTLICDNSQTANMVAFHPSVRTRCVTKLGDVYDPSGTLTGGNANKTSCLERLAQMSKAKQELSAAEKEFARIDAEAQDAKNKIMARNALRSKLQLRQMEINQIRNRAGNSEYARLSEQVEALRREVTEHDEYIKNAPTLHKETEKKVKDLEFEMENFAATKDDKTAALNKKIAELKKTLKEVEKKAKTQKETVENIDMELESLEQEHNAMKETQGNKGKKNDELQKELADLEEKLKTQTEVVKKLETKRDELKAEKKQLEDLIRDTTKAMETLKKEQELIEIEKRKIRHKMDRFKKDGQEAGDVIKQLEKKNPWIETEKQFFGQAGTDFDFDKLNLNSAKKKLQQLEQENATLGRNLNKKVMNMFDKAREDYQDLVVKRDTISRDKEEILSVIDDLDKKKKEAVMRTWTKVNVDFGSIFASLLPGTDAKLEPPPNMLTDNEITGLEIKVAFSDVWKQSLSELSGGQRSLLALSLVLALLRFRPAPMYILDEVDAALDVSHTENIGTMIKHHFPNSQFIIVSLKKGMFDNANVLFRTSFSDGCSRVTRTETNSRGDTESKAKRRKGNEREIEEGEKGG